MLSPDKNTDIKYSIIFLSTIMIKEIKANGVIKYEDLKNNLIDKIGKGISEKYDFTLSFLFLLGKIEYLNTLDSIKIVES